MISLANPGSYYLAKLKAPHVTQVHLLCRLIGVDHRPNLNNPAEQNEPKGDGSNEHEDTRAGSANLNRSLSGVSA